MRRTYISPEFNYNRVFGTFNMREESTFFGSKMLEIEDNLNIHNQGIIYYQNSNSEQIDISIENSLTPIVYSTSDDKKNNHTLIIDDSQSDSQRNTQTRYILNINLSIILRNFLFATLKQYRTFEGIRNNMCYSGDINTSIKEYIEKNIVDRYRFEKAELFIKYNDLRNQNVRRFNNTWATDTNDISRIDFQLKKFQTETDFNQSNVKITFNQEQSSQLFSFEYYFKLFWIKI
jgi:hypothetical protein